MPQEDKALRKEFAKRKRLAIEIASQIHDIVEDTLWSDAHKLPELSQKLQAAVEHAKSFQTEHAL